MSSRSSRQAGVGLVSLTLGMLCLGLSIARPSWASGTLLLLPTQALMMVAGSVLALIGGLILLFIIRQKPEPAPAVPAHVAFYNKMQRPVLVPEMMGRGLPTGGMMVGSGRGASKVVPDQDMIAVDNQIRDLTRRINKAGVMLATGQLSQQGYVAYVEDLKKQRGKLEARRVTAELQRS